MASIKVGIREHVRLQAFVDFYGITITVAESQAGEEKALLCLEAAQKMRDIAEMFDNLASNTNPHIAPRPQPA